MSEVKMLYRNWRGEVARRSFTPVNMFHGTNEYHPVADWLIEGVDSDKNEVRTYALKGFDMTNEVALRDAMISERNALLAEMSSALAQIMGTAAEPEDKARAGYFKEGMSRARAVQEMYSRQLGNG